MNMLAQLDPKYLVFGMLFVGVLIAMEGVRLALSQRDDETARQTARMQGLASRSHSLRHQTTASLLLRLPFFGDVPAKMRQAGITISPRKLLLTCLAIAVPVSAGVGFAIGPLPGLVAGVAVGAVGPTAWVNHVRTKRLLAFTRQLPDALDMMKRGLTVGHPLNVTIATVGREMADPVGTEFRLMADQIAYGDSLTDAIDDLALRIDQEDTHYFAAAVAIQQSAGGNLAAVLGTLSKVIRSRFAMRRRVRAISSEGRISALILSALPFLMYGATQITAPGYYSSVSDDPKFLPMVIAFAVLVTGNALMMRKLVTFRI